MMGCRVPPALMTAAQQIEQYIDLLRFDRPRAGGFPDIGRFQRRQHSGCDEHEIRVLPRDAVPVPRFKRAEAGQHLRRALSPHYYSSEDSGGATIAAWQFFGPGGLPRWCWAMD